MKAGAAQLLVMSVTRLADGVCVACLDSADRWVRPTRQSKSGWCQLEIGDLKDAHGRFVVEVGNVVEWPLGKVMSRGPHTEDRESGGRPVLMRHLSAAEMLQRCVRVRTRKLTAFLSSDVRSLALIEPQNLAELSFVHEGKSGLRARLRFECDGRSEDLSVTDLQWRALGRRLLREQQTRAARWSATDLIAHAKRRVVYLVVGRGQPFEAKHHPLAGPFWPFVTTVFTMPETCEPINYAQL